jgi:hypothetical protein
LVTVAFPVATVVDGCLHAKKMAAASIAVVAICFFITIICV